MQIRKSTKEDSKKIISIIDTGREIMKTKMPDPWPSHYPNQEIILRDIEKGESYVLVEEGTGDVVGTFAVLVGPEELYEKLVEGQWLNKTHNYAIMSRVSICPSQKGKGLGQKVLQECQKIARSQNLPSMKVSTSDYNTQMKKLMKENGYTLCGKFLVHNGTMLVLGYEKNLGSAGMGGL